MSYTKGKYRRRPLATLFSQNSKQAHHYVHFLDIIKRERQRFLRNIKKRNYICTIMINAKIIIVDDNPAVLQTLRTILSREIKIVIAVATPQLLPALIAKDDVDAVLLDMNFGNGKLDGSDGLFWLKRIKEESKLSDPPSVVLITAFGEIELAVQALKNGADDFIQKPWNNERLVETMIDAVVKHKQATNPSSTSNSEKNIIDRLIHSLVQRYASTYAKPIPVISNEAMIELIAIAMEGDISLLEDTIERTTLWCNNNTWEALDITRGEPHTTTTVTIEEAEKSLIRHTLKATNHNLVTTAQTLGISRQTLYNKMKRYELY